MDHESSIAVVVDPVVAVEGARSSTGAVHLEGGIVEEFVIGTVVLVMNLDVISVDYSVDCGQEVGAGAKHLSC